MTQSDTREIQAVEQLSLQRAGKPFIRRQRHIVLENSQLIQKLIRDQLATKKEVAAVLKALGEPVLEKGFFAEVSKQIGSVKEIRRRHPNLSSDLEKVATQEPTSSRNSPITDDDDDDDDAFVARRPRD